MNGNRHGTLVIRTPEGVEFSQPLAGPVSRFAAWLVDCAIIGVVAVDYPRPARASSWPAGCCRTVPSRSPPS